MQPSKRCEYGLRALIDVVDRYTLAAVVDVTLRKMRRNGVQVPFPSGET
jgi:hypothetical protein